MYSKLSSLLLSSRATLWKIRMSSGSETQQPGKVAVHQDTPQPTQGNIEVTYQPPLTHCLDLWLIQLSKSKRANLTAELTAQKRSAPKSLDECILRFWEREAPLPLDQRCKLRR
jgi:hypothetical protein